MAYKYTYDDEDIQVKPLKLKTDRSMLKLMIFNILTLGFYSVIFFIPFSFDLDKIAPPRGRSKTMDVMQAYFLSWLSFSIVLDVWHYQIAGRVEEALEKRNVDYEFGTGDFWRWFIFGSFILVGPFVYFHKLCKAMNLLCADYNERPVIKED